MLLRFPENRDCFRKSPTCGVFFLKSRDSEFFSENTGIRNFFWKSGNRNFFWKSPKFGIFFWKSRESEFFLKIPGIRSFFWKSPGFGNFQDSGFFVLGILIPGIRDFFKFRDFYLRNFSKIPGFRDFWPSRYPGVFLPGSEFSSLDGISRKKASSD